MAVIINVTRRRRDKNYYSTLSSPSNSYANSYPPTPPPPPEGVGIIEKGTLINLTAYEVNILFTNTFSITPIITHLKVYRWQLIATGNYQKIDVLYKFGSTAPLTTSSLSFEIDSSESLTGVIIEYVIQ